MSKEKFDVPVMIVAFVVGMIYSVSHNPMHGVLLLIGILATWNFLMSSKVTAPVRIRIKEREK